MKTCKHCGVIHKLRGNECRICKDGLYRYNMTRNDMLLLYEKQNKKCALCNKELEMFRNREGGFIDHCHKTKKVRGILCNKCNTIVGSFENADIEKVLKYIGD